MKNKLILLTAALITVILCNSQTETSSSPRLKVFVDCSNTWCDMTFIRSEINIVDFYLDRLAADVHVLITSQRTGGGGRQYQMIFYGQNRMKNYTDTLKVSIEPNATDVEERDVFISYLKIGLAPLIAKTGNISSMAITMKQSDDKTGSAATQTQKDPWNYWVFRVGVNGSFSSEQSYKSNRSNGHFSANRTTEALKTGFEFWGGKNKSVYEYEGDNGPEKLEVNNSNYGAEHFLVVSLSDKWSYGYELGYNNSTYSNNKGRPFIRTGVEYNIFPYKEVNNKYFTIGYGISAQQNNYYDTTIYDKLRETLLGHFAEVNISLNKKWGTLWSNIEYRNFLKDFRLNNFEVNAGINARITGGLSFNVHSSLDLIHDQVYLPKEGATEQEVLTRRRQLATSFEFYFGFGISYRFGSSVNNFVNPRFSGPNN